jgi:hypothetical protein
MSETGAPHKISSLRANTGENQGERASQRSIHWPSDLGAPSAENDVLGQGELAHVT